MAAMTALTTPKFITTHYSRKWAVGRSPPLFPQTGELLAGVGRYRNIIRAMTPIATANYDFESLIKGGYVYGRVLLDAQCALRILRNFLH
jgi:hypothetical protein